MPRKVCKSARLMEGSMLLIASTFCGSGLRPLELMMWPKNGISVHLIICRIEMEAGFTSTFHYCFQVCIVVGETITIDDNVIRDASHTREISKGFINFLLKDVLGAYQTEGKP